MPTFAAKRLEASLGLCRKAARIPEGELDRGAVYRTFAQLGPGLDSRTTNPVPAKSTDRPHSMLVDWKTSPPEREA